jgi:hypothetical protein
LCLRGILKVNGPHLMPLFDEVLSVFILKVLTSPLLNPLKLMETSDYP